MCIALRAFVGWTLIAAVLAGCYYSPKAKRPKADSSFLSEAEAEELVQKKLAPYGIKFTPNMKMKRDEAVFIADGYDLDSRVGFEYRSHEGLDFEGESDQNADGLTDAEIEILQKREKDFREYFLIIPEGSRSEAEKATDEFIKNLYAWEVLKKPKPATPKEGLFPEKKGKTKDLLPWEATGDLKKKRKEMEATEAKEKNSGTKGAQEKPDASKASEEDEWGGKEGGKAEEEEF